MEIVKYKTVKWGIFTSPQSGNVQFERYVLETQKDLYDFLKVYPDVKRLNSFVRTLSTSIDNGHIILVTDANRLSGLPTYCFQSKEGDTHPGSFHRVSLGGSKTTWAELTPLENRIADMIEANLDNIEIAEKIGYGIDETQLKIKAICKKLAGKID